MTREVVTVRIGGEVLEQIDGAVESTGVTRAEFLRNVAAGAWVVSHATDPDTDTLIFPTEIEARRFVQSRPDHYVKFQTWERSDA